MPENIYNTRRLPRIKTHRSFSGDNTRAAYNANNNNGQRPTGARRIKGLEETKKKKKKKNNNRSDEREKVEYDRMKIQ